MKCVNASEMLEDLTAMKTQFDSILLDGMIKGIEERIIDAEIVVRCFECEEGDCDGGSCYCNHWRRWCKMSDFCSYGIKPLTQ